MNKFLVILLSLLLFASLSISIGCKKAEKPAEAPKPAEEVAPAPKVKGTESHFQRAHESFLKKDFGAAATEIRKAADFLKEEAGKATGEGKKALEASIHELGQLAKDVEKGAVTSEKKIKDTFARAEHALAKHNQLKASESWAKKETKETGHALKNATRHLKQAAKWSGHELEKGTIDVINGARLVAGKLIEGAGWGTEEVGKGITGIGNEISKLGKKIEPAKVPKAPAPEREEPMEPEE